MPVLIIGAGLVGSQIARLEIEGGENPVMLDLSPQIAALENIIDLRKVKLYQGNILNPLDIIRVINAEKITHIIHTAANPNLTPGAQENPYTATQINIMGTMNVFEAARITGVARVVWCSSSVLYIHLTGGEDNGSPSKEKAWPRPSSFYATAKLSSEYLALNYADAWGLDTIGLRFAAVFGPWKGGGGGGPSTPLFSGMVGKALGGQEVTISKRNVEFVYSKDAAKSAVLACHQNGLEDRIFNVGSGNIWAAEQIGSILTEIIPSTSVRYSEPDKSTIISRPDEVAMDLTRAKEQLGYTPEFPMKNALEDYVQWYKKAFL